MGQKGLQNLSDFKIVFKTIKNVADFAEEQNTIRSGQPHASSSPPFTMIVSGSLGGLIACAVLVACRWLAQ